MSVHSERCIDSAFLCDKTECDCNRFKHLKCNTKTTVQELKSTIEKQKEQLPAHFQNIIKNIIKHFDEAIEMFSSDRQSFIEYTEVIGLNQKMTKIVKLINEDKADEIKGEFVRNCFEQLKLSSKQIYSPIKMPNYQSIRDHQAQINALLNQLKVQLVDSQTKLEMTLSKFKKCENISIVQLEKQCISLIKLDQRYAQILTKQNIKQCPQYKCIQS